MSNYGNTNYKSSPSVDSYQKDTDVNDMAYPAAEVPTSENSKRKTDSSKLPAEQDSPSPVGNGSC